MPKNLMPVPASSLDAAFGVGEERVAAVDDDVALLQERLEFGDDRIHRPAGLHHDQDAARPLEELHKFLDGLAALGLFALGQALMKSSVLA